MQRHVCSGSSRTVIARGGLWLLVVSVCVSTGACVYSRHATFHPRQAEFARAARDGDFDTVKRLVSGTGVDVNFSFPDGSTALLGAARGGHPEIVAFLLEQGADPNGDLRRSAWKYPLERATEGLVTAPDPGPYQRIVELLVASGADSRMGVGGRIYEEPCPRVGNYAEVTALDLSGTDMFDSDLARLSGFVGLQSLDLSGTRVRGTGLRHICQGRTLLNLNLANTPCGDEGVDALCDLTCLRVLGIDNTNISNDGVARLRRALPTCRVRY